jgi:hypothetical protein
MGMLATKSLERILQESQGENELRRSLGPAALVALGVGAIVGAGIFTLTGIVAANFAGPAIVISFVFAAIGCVFAGLCYSEFATMIPIAGSAYTYAYATMGELIAWIIGWDLVLEYCVGSATVSIGWSQTLLALLHNLGVDLPRRFVASPFQPMALPDGTLIYGIINLPAVFVVVFASVVLILGIRESAGANAVIVFLKVSVIVIFIAIGWRYMSPANHTPLIPPNTGVYGHFGWSGIVSGAGVIFFAFIGFDAVSTASQEAKNPQRDMPLGIIGSLAVCTVLFIAYSFVLTGVVNYKDLNVGAPLADAHPHAVALDRDEFGCVGGTDVGHDRNAAGAVAHLLFDGARWLASQGFRRYSSQIPDALALQFGPDGFRRPVRCVRADRRGRRDDEHWHALCLCARLRRNSDHAPDPSERPAPVQDAARSTGADSRDIDEFIPDVGSGLVQLGASSRLAGNRPDHLFQLRPQAQPRPVRGTPLGSTSVIAVKRRRVLLGFFQSREAPASGSGVRNVSFVTRRPKLSAVFLRRATRATRHFCASNPCIYAEMSLSFQSCSPTIFRAIRPCRSMM